MREGTRFGRWGATALLTIAAAMPVQQAAAQDAIGGAILGGAAGAVLGGVLGGGRGAAAGAIIGGSTGAVIAAEGPARRGGHYYYPNGCYMPARDRTYVAVAPEYCAEPVPAPAPVVAVPPPPPPRGAPPPRAAAGDLRERMRALREACEDGDTRSCVKLGIIIGENRERRAQWRRENP